MPDPGEFDAQMRAVFGDRVVVNAPLAPLTTFRVGGKAEWLLETRSADEIVAALAMARTFDIRTTLLGGGSNVLVGDRGIRGLVIRPRGGTIETAGDDRIRADASITINALVRWTIQRGIGGLEAWAGTPGTVGGALHGNAHFGGRLIGDLVYSARVASRDGTVRDVPQHEMEFDYDRSRLQTSGEVLLWAVFRVGRGEPAALREVARRSLAFRKRTQPLETPSAGCVFQNPHSSELPPDIPASAGALIDRAGLKGEVRGGAQVSPAHGNFIVNRGQATAADIRELIDLCRTRVHERFGVVLREEIVYLGEF